MSHMRLLQNHSTKCYFMVMFVRKNQDICREVLSFFLNCIVFFLFVFKSWINLLHVNLQTKYIKNVGELIIKKNTKKETFEFSKG